jgi:hypothetical protein
MNLELIEFGDSKVSQQFHNRQNELVAIRLKKNDTYNDLFKKLKEEFSSGSEYKMKAVVDWIDYNIDIQESKSVLDNVICEVDWLYAIFYFRK